MSIEWMPAHLSDSVKQDFAARFSDPYAAAAAAWEHYAMTLPVEAPVNSVSTGAQSVSYAKGWSEYEAAMERADWFRARCKATAIEVGGRYRYSWVSHERDEVTYPSAAMPPTGPMQINLPGGTVGPKEMK